MLTDDHYLLYAASGPWPTIRSIHVLKPLFADSDGSVHSQSRLDAYIAQTADFHADNDDDRPITLPLAHARGN